MNAETRRRVRTIMETWVESQAPKLRRLNIDTIRQGYPFHQLIFSPDEILAARAERSIVTSMGSELYPRIAVALAQDRFQDVRTEHNTEGEINEDACNLIEQIITQLREPGRRRDRRTPNRAAELETIFDARGGEPAHRSVIADIYVGGL